MFLVDLPTYAAVCALGDADVAASYLILAAGTGADNRTSTWSREAINKRTNLTWRKARDCIDKLEQGGFVRWLTPKGSPRPRFDLQPIETRPRMQKHIEALANKLIAGGQPETATEKGTATTGARDGWLAQSKDGIWQFVPTRTMVKAYLPNSLVGDETGKAIDQSTIVDRIRLTRDPMAFRLLVDLYAAQDLAELGGVDRSMLRMQFADRETVKASPSHQVWHFGHGSQWATWSDRNRHHQRKLTAEEKKQGHNPASDYFDRVKVLQDAGALEWVYYLAEDAKEDSTLIYPVAVVRHGKAVWSELETIVGGYATRAAFALSGEAVLATVWEDFMPTGFKLPADRLAKQATLVGVPRLRCRAKTTNAARWRSELVKEAADTIAMFRGIIAEYAPELLADADRRFADFNVVSTPTSTMVQRDINDSSGHLNAGAIPTESALRANGVW